MRRRVPDCMGSPVEDVADPILNALLISYAHVGAEQKLILDVRGPRNAVRSVGQLFDRLAFNPVHIPPDASGSSIDELARIKGLAVVEPAAARMVSGIFRPRSCDSLEVTAGALAALPHARLDVPSKRSRQCF
jgi:hypothetical protein